MFARPPVHDGKSADAKTPVAGIPEPRPMLVPVSEAASASRPAMGAATAPRSVIGNDLTIIGHGIKIISAGVLEIDGRVDGDVQGTQVIIGETGRLTGTIAAEQVVVKGTVSGQIRGREVMLDGSSHVEGDVHHQRLTIAVGAHFEGRSRRATGELRTTLDLDAPTG
jgi:cytoskeletal protein CcmA (bactofilin family)